MEFDKNTRRKALGILTRERCEAVPALAKFVTGVEQIYKMHESDTAFSRCKGYFSELIRSDFLTHLTNYELRKFAANPLYVPLVSFASQVIIIETENFQLNVGFVNQHTVTKTNRIQTLPSHCMISAASNPLAIDSYTQPEILSDDFRRDLPLVKTGQRVLGIGEIIDVRAAYDIVDFQPQADVTSLVMNFSSKTPVGYTWEFDRSTLLPVRFVPSDNTWSRVDYAIQLITALGDRDYVPTLRRLAAEHPAHFVRWSAIRGVVQLDYDAGLALLGDAASDGHSHVRNAALRTLNNFAATTAAAG